MTTATLSRHRTRHRDRYRTRRRTRIVAATLLAALACGSAAHAETGIDVSRWQHPAGTNALDWNKVDASGVDFAFIKATEGSSYTNPYYASDYTQSKRAGLYRGAYHFARPSRGSAIRQADYFISVAGLAQAKGDLAPVLDLESTGGLNVAELTAWTRAFLERVQQLTGRTPIIYCSPSFWETYLGNSRAFTDYPLWIAHYTSAAAPRVPGGWPTWTFWQNTDSGRVPGIAGNVDLNKFNGTAADLARLARASVAPGPEPKPVGPTIPAPKPIAAALQIATPRQRVRVNRTVTLSGVLEQTGPSASLTPGSAAPSVADQPIDLFRRAQGERTFTRVARTRTNPDGSWSTPVVAGTTATYQARLGNQKTYQASPSSEVAVEVSKYQTAATLEFGAPAARALRGPATLTAQVRGEFGNLLANQPVTLQRRPAGSAHWVPVAVAKTKRGTGTAEFAVRPAAANRYRVSFDGSVTHFASTSEAVVVAGRR